MIKKFIIYIVALTIVIVLLLNGCSSNEPNEAKALRESSNGINKYTQSKIIEYIDNYSKDYEFSGSILITEGSTILFDKAFGMADYDNNIENTTQTQFEIASITKQFTATAILMLQEKNLLSVQDPISKYIPDYPKGDEIKICNLLDHTSGIPDYVDSIGNVESGEQVYTLEELISLFKDEPLEFEVGTDFKYSNSNYILLGYIIEKVSQKNYKEYIEENILKPLSLNSTGFLSNGNDMKNKAIGYAEIINSQNQYEKSIDTEGSFIASAGEMYSTVEDLYRWEEALYSEKIINKQSLNEMFTPNLSDYGYGWFIDESTLGNKSISHGGDLPGYTSYVKRNLDKRYLVIILSNRDDDPYVNYIATGVTKILENK
ncbi:CubicO group peptidase (beta-lactamase class C family) [Clostridium saccharoperbutylacetonicum]|uniref:Penicillin-binding protein 4 n=1 Tax=Clostridium saccharoperbutylacetonicum N1-4(HMT) TaxID=931276 RepID=M1MQS0_9CLOT|nr:MULTISPECIES: serine hydrolase domain-containing protein [Clostridium]AGF58538.1 penicillin-binding protein 4* [Clostridium saccharoperbutylacetonicum N1-4(HMT)]NRT60684.1 CubicO group peptidase (beta-lactamase class C family) [Clostridium saccharoperbutylacetonicum]NSB23998.1 CubicO group peptidase (beta-lactamase class C family) [Clostridium saccharoperbutylacetonicum]NSB43374.1 CubicO group peptidase (beta-lactamase class C family) [Clostridium saccharoperbutylacetonicum]